MKPYMILLGLLLSSCAPPAGDANEVATRAIETYVAQLPATSAPAQDASAPPPAPEVASPSPNLTSPDTPTNTILQSGQAWRKAGLTILLRDYQPNTNPGMYAEAGDVKFSFAVDDQTEHTITYRIAAGVNYWAEDNLGKLGRSREDFHSGTIDNGRVDYFDLVMIGNVADPSITELYLTSDGLGGVENATWVVQLYH